MANTVKCARCNIVINEVLAFVQNKIAVMDNESLIRICVSAFSVEDVEKAKSLLFETLPTDIQKISRRKEGKQKRDMEDIINLFNAVQSEQIPMFVAYDLQKLPPITFDHVDVTKLLKDILVIQRDVMYIKENYVTKEQLNEIKSNVSTSALDEECFLNVNRKRGAYLDCEHMGFTQNMRSDSGKTDSLQNYSLQTTLRSAERTFRDIPINNQCTDAALANGAETSSCNEESSSYRSVKDGSVTSSLEATEAIIREKTGIHCEPTEKITIQTTQNEITKTIECKKTMAEALKTDIKWKNHYEDENWTTVQNKKFRNRFKGQTGIARTNVNSKFKAAELLVPLFITKVSIETSDKDITEYIQNKIHVTIKLEKINMKISRNYNAYKILVPKHKLTQMLDNNMWPEGITFRRFVSFKEREKSDAGLNQAPVLE